MQTNVQTCISGVERLLHCHRFRLLWVGFATACSLTLVQNWGIHLDGARPTYAVGDLLLNYAGGPSRRGVLGAVAISLSQVFGGEPWIWAWTLGCGLTGLLVTFCIRMFRRLPDDPRFMPLILAPWGLLFFAYDTGAALRKELLAYLALMLILQAMGARRALTALVWVLIGSAVFLAGLFAHEAVVLTAPAQVLAMMLVSRKWPELRRALMAVVVVAAIAAVAIVVSLALLPAPDIVAICAAAQVGCFPAAEWLGRSTIDNISFTLMLRGWLDVLVICGVGGLCVVPLLGFHADNLTRGQQIVALGVAVGFVVPLFVLATDWGRWVQMAFFPLCLVALAAVPDGFMRYRRVLPVWAAVLYVASWNLMHTNFPVGFWAVLILPALGGVVWGVAMVSKCLAKSGDKRR